MYPTTMLDYDYYNYEMKKLAVLALILFVVLPIAFVLTLTFVAPKIPYPHQSITTKDYGDSRTTIEALSSASSITLQQTVSSKSSDWRIIVDGIVIATVQSKSNGTSVMYTPSGNPMGHQEPRYSANTAATPDETWIYDQHNNRVGGIAEKSNDKPYPFRRTHGYELQDADSNILSNLPLEFDAALFVSIKNTGGKDLWKIDKELYSDNGMIKIEKQNSDSISSINAIWSVIFMAERNRPYKTTTEKR